MIQLHTIVIHCNTVTHFVLIGNLISFVVMRKGSMKDVSTCFYMSLLALADTGKISTCLPFNLFLLIYDEVRIK